MKRSSACNTFLVSAIAILVTSVTIHAGCGGPSHIRSAAYSRVGVPRTFPRHCR